MHGGLAARDGPTPTLFRDRSFSRLDVIIQMGFPGYFLVVADFIMWAKNQGIAVGPGRGSAAGSIVAYAMGITDLDPIPHGLIFERFLNPERISMPDVDIDFDERRRVEVIRYVTDKYGDYKVAMIGTYGKIKAKNAIKDSARVLDYRTPWATGSPRRCPPTSSARASTSTASPTPRTRATARRARSGRCTRTSRT